MTISCLQNNLADTIHDLLIMHACDTFCDELILLHMLFQSAVITLLLISPVFMKYAPLQIFKTIMHCCLYTETELYMFCSLCLIITMSKLIACEGHQW